MSKSTEINDVLKNNSTQINEQLSGNETIINAEVTKNELTEGELLCGKYKIEKRLDVASGEADLYVCTYNGKKYIAKIYRRKFAIKEEVIKLLKQIDSKNVAKLYDNGVFNEYPFEILPYYEKGSLQGTKHSLSELKKYIIPSINEGLNALHKHGIIHKDIKPSNLMVDNEGNIEIIDFGVSSSLNDGNTIIVTQTGKTPEYSAPETFRELFLAESDYYSFGITIYELFTGTTPYNNLNSEEREMYVTMQKIPKPKDMPDELYDLILGLTYNDLTNRKDKSNPNRRWTYDEVNKWCNGEKQPIPGSVHATFAQSEFSYLFNNVEYRNTTSLADALGKNWQLGKKEFYRGIVSGFFKSKNPQLAGKIMDLETKGQADGEDITFFNMLFVLNPDLRTIYWKGSSFESLQQIGEKIKDYIWHNSGDVSVIKDMLNKGVLSLYAKNIEKVKLCSALKTVEDAYSINPNNSALLFQLSMILTGKKEFFFEDRIFSDITQLSDYLQEKLSKSYSEFEQCCIKLVNSQGQLENLFEAWLKALGKKEALERWKKSCQ